MVASLDGLDVLAFTGGVGQFLPIVRTEIVAGLTFLGAQLDAARNEGTTASGDIAASGSSVGVVVVATGEHLELARHARNWVPVG
jgi:acetate kinase